MAFTGKLGSPSSELGSIVPAYGAVSSLIASSALSLTSVASCTISYTLNMEASSSLVALSQSVVVEQVVQKVSSHTLALTQTASIIQYLSLSETDTLTLTDSAILGEIFVSASNTLALSDEASTLNYESQELSDTLDLTDLARLQSRTCLASNILDLEDEASVSGPIYVSASDELQITDTEFDPDTLEEVTYVVSGLSDSVSVVAIITYTASNIISLADQALVTHVLGAGTDESASDTITLTDVAQLSIQEACSDTLALTDAASAVIGVPLVSALAISDVASVVIARAASLLSDTIELQQSLRFTLEQGCTRHNFSPFIGANTDPNAPTPPPAALPAVSGTTGFRLQYPSTGLVTAEVILPRSPEFGNIDRFQMDRISRESRGGTLLIYADPIWPKITTLVLKFSSLKRTDARALQDFMETYIGREIILVDHEDREWVGVITNPQDAVIQDDRNSFTASFEFQGERA